MPRLVPNPLGDLLHPISRLEPSLARLEAAVVSLQQEVQVMRVLPQVVDHLDRIGRGHAQGRGRRRRGAC